APCATSGSRRRWAWSTWRCSCSPWRHISAPCAGAGRRRDARPRARGSDPRRAPGGVPRAVAVPRDAADPAEAAPPAPNRPPAPLLTPIHWQWANFPGVLGDPEFLTWLRVSLVVAGASTVLALLAAVPAAYYTARHPFRGRTFFLFLVLVTQMFSPTALVVG